MLKRKEVLKLLANSLKRMERRGEFLLNSKDLEDFDLGLEIGFKPKDAFIDGTISSYLHDFIVDSFTDSVEEVESELEDADNIYSEDEIKELVKENFNPECSLLLGYDIETSVLVFQIKDSILITKEFEFEIADGDKILGIRKKLKVIEKLYKASLGNFNTWSKNWYKDNAEYL